MTILAEACAGVQPPPGYVIRSAVDRDVEAVAELMAEEIDEVAGLEVRLLLADPVVGPASFGVAEQGGRIVGALGLMHGEARFGSVGLAYGQIEFVATHHAHRRRGVMSALLDAAHRASRAHGDRFQLIGGIEYVYRRLGYEYAIQVPRRRTVTDLPAAGPPGWSVVAADDLSVVADMQRTAQAAADLSIPPLPGHYRWLAQTTHTSLVQASTGSGVEGFARIYVDEDGVEVSEIVALHPDAAEALLAHAAALGSPVVLVERQGAPSFLLRASAPHVGRDAYYVRVADPIALLMELTPLFDSRLAGSAFQAWSGSIGVTRYLDAFRLDIETGRLVGVAQIDPGSAPPVMIPPDLFATLLFGEQGMAGLEEHHPDVVVDDADLRPLINVLFPPVCSDVIHF
jgi:GNAT superfamily N-acetyltransferase